MNRGATAALTAQRQTRAVPCGVDDDSIARDAVLIEEEGQRHPVRLRGACTHAHAADHHAPHLSVYEGALWGELYDLAADPHECHNLWEEPAHATLHRELLHRLSLAMIHYTDPSPHPTALA